MHVALAPPTPGAKPHCTQIDFDIQRGRVVDENSRASPGLLFRGVRSACKNPCVKILHHRRRVHPWNFCDLQQDRALAMRALGICIRFTSTPSHKLAVTVVSTAGGLAPPARDIETSRNGGGWSGSHRGPAGNFHDQPQLRRKESARTCPCELRSRWRTILASSPASARARHLLKHGHDGPCGKHRGDKNLPGRHSHLPHRPAGNAQHCRRPLRTVPAALRATRPVFALPSRSPRASVPHKQKS